MKKKNLFLGCFICVSVIGVATTAALFKPLNAIISANTEEYKLVVATAPQGISGEYGNIEQTYKTKLGNDIGLSFKEAKTNPTGVCNLNAGGSISNTDALNGAKAIVAVFDGDLVLNASLDSTEEYEELGSLTSGVAFTLPKTYDYLDLIADSETDITSIEYLYECSSRAIIEQTKRYEAEDVLVRVADWNYDGAIIYNESASNGQIVGNLWAGVTFHINHYSYFNGAYTITFKYVNGNNDQHICYGVNGGKTLVDVPAQVPGSWDWANASTISIVVNLRKGYNDIVFGIPVNSHGQYDYFDILSNNKMYDPSDYDMSVTNKMFYAVEAEKIGNANRANDWGGPFFAGSGMGLTNDDANGLKLTFTNMKAGNYNFKMVYGVNPKCTIKYNVNNKPVQTKEMPSTGKWDTLGNVTYQVTFSAGTNTITIMRDGSWINFNAFFVDIK